MIHRQRPRGRMMHALSPLVAAMSLVAGTMAFTGSSAADVSEVGGGAFGASVDVSLPGTAPVISEPRPSVMLAPSGDQVVEEAPSLSVGYDDPSAPSGGNLLKTGALSVESQGATGPSGSSTSSAAVADVDALDSFLTATEIASTCVSTEAGPTASTTLTDGTFWLSETERAGLPPDPAPNTVVEDALTIRGEPVTVILNEHIVDGGSIVVNAVHLVLEGPSANGAVVLAQSRCGVTATAPSGPAVSDPSVTPVTEPSDSRSSGPAAPVGEPSGPESTEAVPPVIEPSEEASSVPASQAFSLPAGDPPAETLPASTGEGASATSLASTSKAEKVQSSRDVGGPLAVAVPGADALFAAAQASELSGGAYGFRASISLFGGPAGVQGPAPVVELPPAGADPPLTATAPSGQAQYGPATIFESGPMTVTTGGAAGSVTSSAEIQGTADGPGPFLYERVQSTCTATGDGATGSTTIAGGVLEIKYDATSQEPIETVPVPANPAPNTERAGTIDHVGDSYRIVFNEQITGEDGSITVNAAHMYLEGPTAIGDLIIGQSRCGGTAGGTGGTGTGGGAGTGGAGKGSQAGSGSGSGTGARSGTGGRSGTGSRAGNLADTGGETPMLLASLLMLGAFTMWRSGHGGSVGERRRERLTGGGHAPAERAGHRP